jgi:hypothetical protein
MLLFLPHVSFLPVAEGAASISNCNSKPEVLPQGGVRQSAASMLLL